MAELRRRRSVSQAHLLRLLESQLADLVTGEWRPLDVVDLGGGTGVIAIPLAARGHRVTVVDPSPDALASLERRTAEAELTGRIAGRQGDAADLVRLIGEHQADVVICHRVLEVIEVPAEALLAMATTLRPGGVLSQALAGHIALARRSYADPTRLDYDQVIDAVRHAGFTVLASHGIGAIADLVPERLVEEPGAYDELVALEAEISQDPAFRALAPQVHVFAQSARSR